MSTAVMLMCKQPNLLYRIEGHRVKCVPSGHVLHILDISDHIRICCAGSLCLLHNKLAARKVCSRISLLAEKHLQSLLYRTISTPLYYFLVSSSNQILSLLPMHCSLIIRPRARLVFKQERKEGDFRFAHMRLRSFLTEVTLYRAGAAERTQLDHKLQPVLANQLRLVMWRWLLGACMTGLEYAGALLNYSCLGLVVFTGGACSWRSSQHRMHASKAIIECAWSAKAAYV